MNRIGQSKNWFIGLFLLILGLGIISFNLYSCISNNEAMKVADCIFSLNKIIFIAVGTLIGFIGSMIGYYSH